MKYLAVLGRQPEISLAELSSVLGGSCRAFFSPKIDDNFGGPPPCPSLTHIKFVSGKSLDINRFGGILKLAVLLEQKPLEFLQSLPEGKLTIGVSDYSDKATKRATQSEALKLKKILVRYGRSVRVVENKDAVLSTATSLHNGLNGKNERKVELIKLDNEWYRVVGVQDIDAYTKRDQARPARDAKVGMLPPKLAQILINLCGLLRPGSVILDPFCGTGVVLQEALLMGYRTYGTDISERMIEYSKKNLEWLVKSEIIQSEGIRSLARRGRAREPHGDGSERRGPRMNDFQISLGDATSFKWNQPIDAVACEVYLGKPFSRIPTEMELKEQKQECQSIVLGFLKNLSGQIKKNIPVVTAIPAWLRESGTFERLDVLDEIQNMGYNVSNKTREGLLYCREKQIVARDILILRKK